MTNQLNQNEIQNLQFGQVVRLRENGNRYMVDGNNGRTLQLRNLGNGRSDYYSVDSVVLFRG